jgi:hypothetical protein
MLQGAEILTVFVAAGIMGKMGIKSPHSKVRAFGKM